MRLVEYFEIFAMQVFQALLLEVLQQFLYQFYRQFYTLYLSRTRLVYNEVHFSLIARPSYLNHQ